MKTSLGSSRGRCPASGGSKLEGVCKGLNPGVCSLSPSVWIGAVSAIVGVLT